MHHEAEQKHQDKKGAGIEGIEPGHHQRKGRQRQGLGIQRAQQREAQRRCRRGLGSRRRSGPSLSCYSRSRRLSASSARQGCSRCAGSDKCGGVALFKGFDQRRTRCLGTVVAGRHIATREKRRDVLGFEPECSCHSDVLLHVIRVFRQFEAVQGKPGILLRQRIDKRVRLLAVRAGFGPEEVQVYGYILAVGLVPEGLRTAPTAVLG